MYPGLMDYFLSQVVQLTVTHAQTTPDVLRAHRTTSWPVLPSVLVSNWF